VIRAQGTQGRRHLVLSRRTQFGLPLAPFKNGTAHVERIKERPSAQKLLAYEKDVQGEFARVA